MTDVDPEGNLYDKSKKLLCVKRNVRPQAYKGRLDILKVRFSSGVKKVGESAFWGCNRIKDILFANGLEDIGACAFSNCSGITNLPLPDTLNTIGNGAFAMCSGIIYLRIPKRVTSLGKVTFTGCSGIVDIELPDGMLFIALSAFYRCTSLETIVLPENVIFPKKNALIDLLDNSFADCTSLARVLAPDALVKGVMADPAKVFKGCPVLTGAGLTPCSAVPLLRRTLWHPTMHAWCTPGQRACVLAVLVAELRSDRQEEETAPLPLLVHDLWLLILQFVFRRDLGRTVAF